MYAYLILSTKLRGFVLLKILDRSSNDVFSFLLVLISLGFCYNTWSHWKYIPSDLLFCTTHKIYQGWWNSISTKIHFPVPLHIWLCRNQVLLCNLKIWHSSLARIHPSKVMQLIKMQSTYHCLYRGGWKKWQENSRVFFQSETCICRRSWEVFGNTVVLKYLQMDVTVSSSLVFLIRFLRLTAWGKFTFK